jgi:hypothetical protein
MEDDMARMRKSPAPRISPLSSEIFRTSGSIIFARTVHTPSEKPPLEDVPAGMLDEQETTRSLGHAKKRESGLSVIGRLAAML